ncbi:FKBP-type peptidyl-prolyl cis-trans isomerase [Rufibacter glacialis]|nr:FKBP-type peptidyl-prolyl cis-trans isomerase [Rufibacter glacialis]
MKRSALWQMLLAVCVLFGLQACGDQKDPYDPYANYDYEAQAKFDDEMIQAYMKAHNIRDTVKTATGLYYKVLKPGTGPKPVAGSTVKVHYIGKLVQNEYIFDSSWKRSYPYEFQVGANKVIKGWDQGLPMMQKGEKALLFIPSHLGYGPVGSYPAIPSGAPLLFEVDLLEIL